MSISVVEYLMHIRDEAQFLEAASASLSVEQFVRDPTITRACIRAIEIIGEASKKVSEDLATQGIFTAKSAKNTKTRQAGVDVIRDEAQFLEEIELGSATNSRQDIQDSQDSIHIISMISPKVNLG